MTAVAPVVALLLGFCTGAVSAGLSVGVLVHRRHIAATRALRERVTPVLERHAGTLGLPVSQTVRVSLGNDGELEVRASDPDPLVSLLDAIDAHEQGHLGFVDTMRVSRDEVDQQLRTTAPRKKAS